MAKRSIKAVRRDELLEAAIEVVGESGLAGATVANIASRAGMSTGLVNHYFGSKQELMALAMRNLSNVFRQDILELLPPNATPLERLKAIIDGSFVSKHFSGSNRKAWIQFMIESQSDADIRDLMRITGSRFVSNIRFAVRGLVPAEEVDDVADGIAAMIDGFFWQIASDYDEREFENARRICWKYVCLLVPEAR